MQPLAQDLGHSRKGRTTCTKANLGESFNLFSITSKITKVTDGFDQCKTLGVCSEIIETQLEIAISTSLIKFQSLHDLNSGTMEPFLTQHDSTDGMESSRPSNSFYEGVHTCAAKGQTGSYGSFYQQSQ